MSRLLLASVIKERICAYLSFVDIVNLRDALGLSSLKIPILVTDSKNKQIILPGVNSMTVETYILIKQHGCDLALIKAVDTGQNEIVKILLTAEVDVNVADQNGWTALMWATVNHKKSIVEILLTAKEIDRNKSLMISAGNGWDLLVKTLLPTNNINATDKAGWTVLMIAAANGHDSIVKTLLTVKDIDVNAISVSGISALMLAAKNGQGSVVRTLLTVKGININITDREGKTALMWAAFNGMKEVIQILLTVQGININAVNRFGQSALMLAAGSRRSQIVECLKAAGSL